MVMVKICGITNEDDLEAAVDAGTDSLGFVVGVPSSPRNLSIPIARHLIGNVPGGVNSVAVTVFDNVDRLRQVFAELKPDYLQIHGDLCQMLAQLSEIRDRAIIAVDGGAKDASKVCY